MLRVSVDRRDVDSGGRDYLDIGTPLFDGRTVPVVIESLVFGS